MDIHLAAEPTVVGAAELCRHTLRRLEGDRAFVVASGLGLPRTWAMSTRAALEGFASGLAQTSEGAWPERLRVALAAARSTLAERCDRMVERMLPDVALVGLALGEGELHVLGAGPVRVYHHDRVQPKRLTTREEGSTGLLRARPAECTTAIASRDIVLAGSVTAFSTTAIANAVSRLEREPDISAEGLAKLLVAPSVEAGVGAAALVLRVL